MAYLGLSESQAEVETVHNVTGMRKQERAEEKEGELLETEGRTVKSSMLCNDSLDQFHQVTKEWGTLI